MDTSEGSHTQIKQNRGQIVNIVGKVQVQKTIPEQKARTIELSNITQIDEMEVEDTQAQVTIRSWNTEDSEQNTQSKSYSKTVRRPSITGCEDDNRQTRSTGDARKNARDL
ncbi:39706_t:CDS:2 [Gigaspora margarita]|uniref:39706_t:CDS:1 n=1 Tax=Gigaspora margarita TaxID=4874 RepID=A0ABN7V7M4_GIGMA|nr:39706_t:CDS:2 [Gigaspora margarita]